MVALLVVLLLETQRLVLEVLTQTVERYDLMIVSNLFLSSSVLLGILAYPWVGAIGFPVANGLALALANIGTVRRLAALGFRFRPDHAATLRSLSLFGVSVLVGHACRLAGADWKAALGACLLAYFLLFLKFQWGRSMAYARDLMGRR